MIGKVSASCSGIHQASDVSPVFRNAKQALKCLHDRGVKVSNPVLFNLVISAITEFEKENSIQVGSEYKGKIAQGCVVITRAMQDGQISSHVRRGFEDCGQFPLSFHAIMKQCFKAITFQDMQAMEMASIKDVEYFKQHGFITDEILEQSHPALVSDHSNKPRDQRPLQNQRATVVNHLEVINRYLQVKNRGEPIGEALLEKGNQNKNLDLQKALKIVEGKRLQDAKKDNEKKRMAELSQEEKDREKEAKRKKTAENKKKKEEKYEQSLKLVQSYHIKQ